jgi:glutaredoxin-like YruB-family protein
MVKVYSISNCPWCTKVKKYLKVNNVEFEEHNVEENDADRDALYKISGDLIVPVTTIDGKNYVLSFDKAKLDALLGL